MQHSRRKTRGRKNVETVLNAHYNENTKTQEGEGEGEREGVSSLIRIKVQHNKNH